MDERGHHMGAQLSSVLGVVARTRPALPARSNMSVSTTDGSHNAHVVTDASYSVRIDDLFGALIRTFKRGVCEL